MTTDRQKEKAQTKYLSKFSDNQIHELKDTTIPEYLFIRDLPGGAGGRSDII
jgi:hypothetical protein